MQEKESNNTNEFTDIFRAPTAGRLVALDIGTKNIGVAVSDEIQFTVRPLPKLQRTNWKKLLLQVKAILIEFDAVGLVLGLPLNFDGSESEMSVDVRRLAKNFTLSLETPVFLQDERVSSITARENLHQLGYNLKEIFERVDSESAAVILTDFIAHRQQLLRSL